jgi:ATP-binding cassette, subfamily B, bacterial HlyB/CyaB
VAGVQTLKVQPMLKNQWEEKLASYVKTSFDASVFDLPES